jgi:Acetyltransferase (GNAT) domain
MKDNYETCLVVGRNCVLVPYREEHVPKYHEWMKDPTLLEATGSDPLSLEEEIEMQQSWRDDPKKCTFIILATELMEALPLEEVKELSFPSVSVSSDLGAMVGDVNLFLSDIEDDEGDEGQTREITQHLGNQDISSNAPQQAEIDIMIAEHSFQRKGIGKSATCAMLLYGAEKLDIVRFFCKINETNTASIQLFKSLGFEQCDYAACFKQVELELRLDGKGLDALQALLRPYGHYHTVPCPL